MAKAKTHNWLLAEDFYLRAHISLKKPAEIATDLGIPVKQVQARIKELDLKPTSAERTQGFQIQNNTVTMTSARSQRDDQNTVPPAKDLSQHPKYKNTSSKLF